MICTLQHVCSPGALQTSDCLVYISNECIRLEHSLSKHSVGAATRYNSLLHSDIQEKGFQPAVSASVLQRVPLLETSMQPLVRRDVCLGALSLVVAQPCSARAVRPTSERFTRINLCGFAVELHVSFVS